MQQKRFNISRDLVKHSLSKYLYLTVIKFWRYFKIFIEREMHCNRKIKMEKTFQIRIEQRRKYRHDHLKRILYLKNT